MTDTAGITQKSGDTSSKILALLLSVFSGAVAGVAAVFLQRLYAPFGVFPLFVGMLTGGATMLPLALARPRGFVLSIAAALVASLTCLAVYHLGTFVVARGELLEEAERVAAARRAIQAQMGDKAPALVISEPTPIKLKEYYELQWQIGRPLGEKKLIKGPMLAAWWMLDGLLIWLGASIVTASFTTRPPPPNRTQPPDASPSDR